MGWCAVEIARARKMLTKGESIEAVLESLSRGLTQKMLHGTLVELNATDVDSRADLTHTVSRLFLRNSGSTTRRQPAAGSNAPDPDPALL